MTSVVEFLPSEDGNYCGYCKSPNGSLTHGMWAHSMSVKNYQDLIDRGWRRSGKYCYKPILRNTCCPLYTIRCDAMDFTLSKSQKKLLRKMSKFLKEGLSEKSKFQSVGSEDMAGYVSEQAYENRLAGRYSGKLNYGPDFNIRGNKSSNDAFTTVVPSNSGEGSDAGSKLNNQTESKESVLRESRSPSVQSCLQATQSEQEIEANSKSKSNQSLSVRTESETERRSSNKESSKSYSNSSSDSKSQNSSEKLPAKQGLGRDPSKPQCRKAKQIRLEKKIRKLEAKGESLDTLRSNSSRSSCKSLEEFVCDSGEGDYANTLVLRLVPANSTPDMLNLSWQLYVKYQMAIHNEKEEECNFTTFKQFLVDSPLLPSRDEKSPSCGYGSFHHQYWLNGNLIAVGVIDILPKCISSVYFFYDPYYSFLSLGTYGALREIELVRALEKKCAYIRSYYMGFYIHTCPKMRYKGNFAPSFLLCPESYIWYPLETCIQKLEKVRYARFNANPIMPEDSEAAAEKVLLLWRRKITPYKVYKIKNSISQKEEQEIALYAELVGDCCSNMLLYRISMF